MSTPFDPELQAIVQPFAAECARLLKKLRFDLVRAPLPHRPESSQGHCIFFRTGIRLYLLGSLWNEKLKLLGGAPERVGLRSLSKRDPAERRPVQQSV